MTGKRVRGATYHHRSATHLLTPPQTDCVERAQQLAPDAKWNVVRLEPDIIAFLEYEDFDQAAFPALLGSCRVNLIEGTNRTRRYDPTGNPLLLHRKELTLDPADPRVATWSALTRDLVARGLFKNPHLIGRRLQWEERLAAAGIRIVEHRACLI